MEQACYNISVQKNPRKELLVCADRFNISAFNRWTSDYNILYGDAASTVELGKEPGRFAIEYIGSISSWDLEELHRNCTFQKIYEYNSYDTKRCKKQYLSKYGRDVLKQQTSYSLLKLYDDFKSITKIDKSMIDLIVTPNLGDELVVNNYLKSLGLMDIPNTTAWGKTVGHLGCGDCMIALDIIDKKGEVKSGDRVLLLGAGAGFSWSLVLVRKR